MNQPSHGGRGLGPAELWQYALDPEPYRVAGIPDWIDELDLKPAPPYLKMGTRALDLDTWLTPDVHRDAEVALRNRLLDEQRPLVFGCAPSADAAAAETLRLVVEWLTEHTDVPADQLVVDPDEHPLISAARLVQEDLCLMVQRDGSWYFDGGVVCFPTLWLLEDKIGRTTTALHGPVAHYVDELAERVDRFFDRLTPDRPVWRRNLGVKPYPLLFLAADKLGQPLGETLQLGADAEPLWLRSERQTLRILPDSGAILFTIRVQIAPAGCLRQLPDRAGDLAAMYRAWDTGQQGYKMGGNDLVPAFIPWLERVAAGH